MTTLRNFIIGTASALALATLSTAAQAQVAQNPAPTATADAQMSVTIQSPLTLAKTSDLAFGRLIKPSTGTAQATLSSAGTLTYEGGAKTGTPTAAAFTVTSVPGTVITPSFTATGGIIGLTGFAILQPTGASSADVAAGATGARPAITMANTTEVLRYGAQFTVAAETAPGVYSGNLNVVVSYQ
jgi:hypothetical protein